MTLPLAYRGGAELSKDGLYRYRLWRVWDRAKPILLYVMLNPSTADAEVDDATIRSCVRLARDLGFGRIEVVNLYAWRATDPRMLINVVQPIGEMNDIYVADAVDLCEKVVFAWGAFPWVPSRRIGEVLDIVSPAGKRDQDRNAAGEVAMTFPSRLRASGRELAFRMSLPYGVWLLKDGREVLFNREYQPIWQRSDSGHGEQADPKERVEWISQNWFWSDSDTPWESRKTLLKCYRILTLFLGGKSLKGSELCIT